MVVERAERSAVQLHEAAISEGLQTLLGESRGEEQGESYVGEDMEAKNNEG